jgi:hypothetical protein
MKWEYRIRYIEPVAAVAVSAEEAKLEELGADGWEAVSAGTTTVLSSTVLLEFGCF